MLLLENANFLSEHNERLVQADALFQEGYLKWGSPDRIEDALNLDDSGA